MNRLHFFETPKEDLKMNMIFVNEPMCAELEKASDRPETLPDVDTYYTKVCFPKAPENRPYIVSSIVVSADGKMAFHDNPAGPLVAKNNFLDPAGALGDFWVLNFLRALCDGVVIGANTLHKEPGISSHVYDNSLWKQRQENLQKKEHPVSIVVSMDGTDIPFDHFSFHVDPQDRLKQIVATSPKGLEYIKNTSGLKHEFWGTFKTKADVDAYDFGNLFCDFDCFPVFATGEDDRTDSEVMLYLLRKIGMERLCIESPSFCAHLLHGEMLDEYFINYSMVYAGGTTTPAHNQPFGHLQHPHADLLSVGLHHSNFLYTRQKVRYNVTNEIDLTAYKY